MSSSDQRQFLDNEFFRLTLEGTMQRSKVYIGNEQSVSELARKEFQRTLRKKLDSLADQYTAIQPEERHIQNIADLADTLSREHQRILAAGRFRIGCAQKALNLFLKYRWCMGEIPTPPHCPFDGQIIQLLKLSQLVNWTTFDEMATYRLLVQAAKEKAGEKTLAEWELMQFNDFATS